MQFIIDASEFPLVRITYPAEASYDEIDQYRDQLLALHRERGSFYAICDINAVSVTKASAKHRAKMSEAIDSVAGQGVLLAETVVADGAPRRGLVKAYEWIRGSKHHPFKCVKSVEEAEAFIAQLRAQPQA